MTRFYYDAQGREHESGDWDAALAARPEPRSCDPREHGGKHAPWCHAARSEPRAEGLREALQAIIDLRTVVPDHAHGGIHPPYLEWVKVAEIARAALAARPEPRCEMCARGDRDTHAQHMARSEPRAEGLRPGDWLCPTCGTLFRHQPDAATPPAEGLDVERLRADVIAARDLYQPDSIQWRCYENVRHAIDTMLAADAALAPEQPE